MPASASTGSGGHPYDITFASDGYVWFLYTGTRTAAPACANGSTLWMISTSSPGSQAVISALLTASARQQIVDIQGTGTCINGNEGIGFVVIKGQ